MSHSALRQLDARLSSRLQVIERFGALRIPASVLAHSGDSWFGFLGLAILWWLGAPFWKEWAAMMFFGIVLLAPLVWAFKMLKQRPRPEGEWGTVYRIADPYSFPSGHAARTTMLAVVALGVGPPWLAGVLATWGLFVCLARVGLGVHYLSDVVAGMAMGGLFGLAVLRM